MINNELLHYAKHLTLREYGDAFNKCWLSLKQCFRKTETLQSYGVDDEASIALVNKDYDKFKEILAEFRKYIDMDNRLLTSSVSQKRLRYVKKPLSNYLRSECYVYRVLSELGQEVKVSEDKNITKYDDMLIFDDQTIFFLIFNNDGEMQEVFQLERNFQTGHIIDEAICWFDENFNKSQSSEEYFELDKQIEEWVL